MSTLRKLLEPHAAAVLERWFEDVLRDYGPEAGTAFRGQRDRFANPVGHSLRAGTRATFDALLEGAGAESCGRALDEIVRIRAVQQFSPSRAVRFVFRLKDAIRQELGDALDGPELRSEWTALQARIDEAALAAFDVYVEYRERVSELRINELKRNIPWSVERSSRVALEGEAP